MSDSRINARLDDQTTRDLQYLRKLYGDKSTTDILKQALQELARYEREELRAKNQKKLWLESDLIACIRKNDQNLSVNYKDHIGDYLDEKYSV